MRATTSRVDSRAKFTPRGWCFLVAAVLCLAAATWLGRKDVLALSLFLGAVPLLASLAMWLVKPRVLLKRSVDPEAVLTVREMPHAVDQEESDGSAPAAEQWAASQTVVVPPEAGSVVGRAGGLMRGPRGGGMRI